MSGDAPDDEDVYADVIRDLSREPMALYEVWYAANNLSPSAQMSERVASAERVITRLVSSGAVTLWAGEWVGRDPKVSIDAGDIEAILRQSTSWLPGDQVVWMELRSG